MLRGSVKPVTLLVHSLLLCVRLLGEAGVPESFCSYQKTMIGMADSGVLPKPLLIAATTLACDANQLSFRHLAAHYPAPLTLIDVPAREDDAAVACVADQLRELARTLETLTGRKLDEAKLRESMACANRTLALMREYADLRAEVSQDTTMTGELCSLIATHCLLGHADGENYVRELIETAKRAPRRETTRRKRIFFIHTLPNWQDSMIRMLETENRCELVGCDITFDSLMPLDPDKPFGSMARRLLANGNGGRSTRGIDNAIAWAKKLNADGVIVFCHWGCILVPPGYTEAGLRVYRHLVLLGASQMVQAHYPALREQLGDDDWRALMQAFVRQSAWASPFYEDLKDEFTAFLARASA